MNILITGATGNVGLAILKSFANKNHSLKIFAGVRDAKPDSEILGNINVTKRKFDFENIETVKVALHEIDVLFLLRPPQISDVQKYFKPIIETTISAKVKHIVFLSVLGVQNSKIIPHHKIEKLIVESGINYTSLRPAYFMQNFTTTLLKDITENHRIFLPARKAKFTLIDVEDVGKVSANILADPNNHINKHYELTNNETLTFGEMADKLSKGLGRRIEFISPNLLRFFIAKRKDGLPIMLILVMIMLHYFPRFQNTPKTTNCVKELTGLEPKTFDQFVADNINRLK
ncbi:NmrA family transcriptional regulator [Schleiferia thermophila str. Yellowstone]|uniref:NmrA family NAD(P)-binding protein n=1 Tax=Schleiferia thermophila TaxID=884107 RepID=UPI0004E75328|nr:NmrA family NAD(P)-binding protein [Schleiferia thermophila]KFD40045.1 NmrA family transcriptional regulator [Schleiferia thermophila str. Yellowstone]